MPDLLKLVDALIRDGQFERTMNNPLGQFGTQTRQYIGATLLPEDLREDNQYTEDGIKFRTVIAAATDRYSPAQLRGNEIVGSFDVKLGDQDIAREMSGREFDALNRMLAAGNDLQAAAALLNWVDIVINRGMLELAEKERWDAILNASVIRKGDAGQETVTYANPAGHRVAASAAWSNPATDPRDDIFALMTVLANKGHMVNRIITTQSTISILLNNPNMRGAIGDQYAGQAGRLTLAQLNSIFEADGLPPIERYNLRYTDVSGDAQFLPDGNFVMVATTGRDMAIDNGDAEDNFVVADTIGYYGVGVPTGRSTPGRTVWVEPKDNKPPRIESEGWGVGLPVITEPEAIGVINTIS